MLQMYRITRPVSFFRGSCKQLYFYFLNLNMSLIEPYSSPMLLRTVQSSRSKV